MKISIVIPAHNEEGRIRKTLKEYGDYFSRKTGLVEEFELIVVLNGCKDNTLDVIKKLAKNHKEIRHLDFKHAGKGFAVIQGFKEALKRDNDLIGFTDADMSTSPESFYKLIENIRGYDGAIANRWDKRSIFKYSLFKKLRSRIYNYFVRFLFFFPFEDTQCGAKIFTRKILERNMNKIVSSDFNFDVALLFCLREESNARIISVPTVWEEKAGSKIFSIKSPLRMFLSAIRLRLIHSPFKFIARFYRKLPNSLKIHEWLK